MSIQTISIAIKRKETLELFLNRWKIDDINKMTLQDYNAQGSKDSFCYWLEHVADNLGRIKGSYSSMFGIWQMKVVKSSTSEDFLDDGNYKWYRKYGNTAEEAFVTIREHILNIANSALNGSFNNIDSVDYFSLVKWKIAFIYSKNKLFPVYNKTALRQIAKNFDYSNYRTGRLSSLHQFLVTQAPENEDLFEFAFCQYHIAIKKMKKNYYIIGSKYRDDYDNYYDISSSLYNRNVISTGFFWDEDLTNLFGKPKGFINKWLDKYLLHKYPENYNTAKQTLSHFLSIKEGDIIAVKSKGQFNALTIIAYAEVVKVDGKIYFHDETNELGHCINVNYLEIDLDKYVGLNYAQTIHQIIPNQRIGHFEKIFGNYTLLEKESADNEIDDEVELNGSKVSTNKIKSHKREVSYSTTINRIHDKLRDAFALNLQVKYPEDNIHTEYKFIDVVRQNSEELFYYEVKPFNTVYGCIRSAMGQLLDYTYSNPDTKKKISVVVVGSAEIDDKSEKFIEFVKLNLNIPFDYIQFNENK
jgi:hypothetical protein